MPWDPFQPLCQWLLQLFSDSLPPAISNLLWNIISAAANPYRTINCNCLLQSTAPASLNPLTGFFYLKICSKFHFIFAFSPLLITRRITVLQIINLDFGSLPPFCISLQHYDQCNQLTKLWKQNEVFGRKAQSLSNFDLVVFITSLITKYRWVSWEWAAFFFSWDFFGEILLVILFYLQSEDVGIWNEVCFSF